MLLGFFLLNLLFLKPLFLWSNVTSWPKECAVFWNLLRSLSLLKHWSHIMNFHLQVAFETPDSTEHEYMQMNSLIMRLTPSCFKPSVLVVHLQLNYTMFDVWLAVLIFTLCQLLHWRASQAVRCLSSTVNCFISLILNCWRNPDLYSHTWWYHKNNGSSLQVLAGVKYCNRMTYDVSHILGVLENVLWLVINVLTCCDLCDLAGITSESAHAIPKGNRMRCFSLQSKKNAPAFVFTGI